MSVLSSRMQTAEAELLYIKEVEKLDGFGQESFPAKVDITPSPASYSDTHTHHCRFASVFDCEKILRCPYYVHSVSTGQLHQ